MDTAALLGCLGFVVDRVNVGIFIVDRDLRVLLWNRFMTVHSGHSADRVFGKPLFECFPELPEPWLRQKIESVLERKSIAFISSAQRPFLSRSPQTAAVTGGVDVMRQDCTLIPIKDDEGEVIAVCFSLLDRADVSIYQTRLEEAMEELECLSRFDALTGVASRGHWERRLGEEFARACRYGSPLSLVLLDLDELEQVNDRYGHQGGDEVLQEIGRRLEAELREVDVPGRYGGEEFAVLLPSTDLGGAVLVAERLRRAIADRPIPWVGGPIPVTASLGIAAWTPDLTSHEKLVAAADDAMCRSKSQGRNRWNVAPVGVPVIEAVG